MRILPWLIVGAMIACCGNIASAQDAPAFKRWYTIDYTIRTPELIDVDERIETEVLAESMVQSLGQHRIIINNHFYDLEIVEAATLKADGRRIEVQRDQIASVIGTTAATDVLFNADSKTQVIPFRDLAAGDRTLIVTRRVQKEAVTATGGNSVVFTFPPSLRFTQAVINVKAPRGTKLNVFERALTHETIETEALTNLRWTVDPPTYAAAETNEVAAVDWAPMLAVSTFESWEALGRRAFSVADGKSEPTPEIRKLADEITSGVTGRKAQATAIFDWVARNIRYYQIVLGQGGWTPHEAGRVLSNRYGDCKDHATLMRALLRAKDIDAEYVLINAGNRIYKPFEIPLASFDHMILYLPEFDSYADPTASTSSFGLLPTPEHGRTVLRLGKGGITLAQTPVLNAADVFVEFESDVTIAADGTVTGQNAMRTNGVFSIAARNLMRSMEQSGPAETAKSLLARQQWSGTGTFALRSPFDRTEPYEVKGSFNLTTKMFGEGVTPSMMPAGPRAYNPPVGDFRGVVRDNRLHDFYCMPVTYNEMLTVRLPQGKTIIQLPKAEKETRGLAEFHSSYTLDGQVLKVARSVVWRLPGTVCTRQMANELAAISDVANRDFSKRLVIVDARK